MASGAKSAKKSGFSEPLPNLHGHFSLIKADFLDALRNFSWESRQTRQAMKTGLACCLAVFLMYFLDLNEAYWAGISAMIMMRPNLALTIQKGWMRAGGACLGAYFGVIITGICVQQHYLFTAVMLGMCTVGLYKGATCRYGYFWSYFALNAVIISIVSMVNPPVTLYIAVFRGAAVTMGVLSSLFINVVLWPDYAHEEIRDKNRSFALQVYEFINEIISQYLSGEISREKIDGVYSELKKVIRRNRGLFKDAALEIKLLKEQYSMLDIQSERLSNCVERFMDFYQNLTVYVKESGKPPEFQKRVDEEIRQLMNSCSKIAAVPEPDPEDIAKFDRDSYQLLTNLTGAVQREIFSGSNTGYPVMDVITLYEAINLLEGFRDDLAATPDEHTVSAYTESNPGRNTETEPQESDLARFRFFKYAFALHIPSLKYAFKGALGIVICFWLWFWAEIPGGGINMSLAVVTVLQLDFMSTYHRGLLRLLGCLVGAIIGLGFLGLQVESTFVLFLSLFMVTSCCAYIWGARPGVAYLGCQAGLAFMIAVVHDAGPVTSLAPPVERLVGITLGVLVIWIINMLVWPQDFLAYLSRELEYAKKQISLTGKVIAAAFSKQDFPPEMPLDIASIDSNLQALLFQQELPGDQGAQIREWLTLLARLRREDAVFRKCSPDAVSFVSGLLPGFGEKTTEITSMIAITHNAAHCQDADSRLELLDQEIIAAVNRLREEQLLKGRNMDFKKDTAHVLLLCRWIVRRLRKIAVSQVEFYKLLAASPQSRLAAPDM